MSDETVCHAFETYQLAGLRARAVVTPAPHQNEALKRLARWYAEHPSGGGALLALPTGGGKTFTATHFLCSHPLADGYKVLWLAHTHHLLEQAACAFGSVAGLIQGSRATLTTRVVSGTVGHHKPRDIQPTDDVIIATIQTFWNGLKNGHASIAAFVDAAKGKLCVVIDEAHHTPAPTYRKLVEDLRARAPNMLLLGLTATPTYTNESRRGWLPKLYPQWILYEASVNELIAAGVLARPVFKEPVKTNIATEIPESDYQRWLGTHRDIPESIIEQLAENRDRNDKIVAEYVENRSKYGKTIIFADRWFQCEALCEGLKKRGASAGAMYSHVEHGPSTVDERNQRTVGDNAKVLAQFRNGELDVIVNIRMLTEGTDVPKAQTVFITRQTTSQILMTQMVGRALRGPAFGGTAEANIVMFIDDWKQRIQWARPEAGGGLDDGDVIGKARLPLQLVSIELVRLLARQMDSGINVNPGPYLQFLPNGWYLVKYRAEVDGEDLEPKSDLVLVFDDERQAYERFVSALLEEDLQALSTGSALAPEMEARLCALESMCFRHVPEHIGGARFPDLLAIAYHAAQSGGQGPTYFEFSRREAHDLDKLALFVLAQKLDRGQEDDRVLAEYDHPERFWRALYHSYDMFKSHFDGCMNRILHARRHGAAPVTHEPTIFIPDSPTLTELTVEQKKEVFARDGRRCLCCQSKEDLRVDHVISVYNGGSNDMDNLQTLCATCNIAKSVHYIDFRRSRTHLTEAPAPSPRIHAPEGTRARDLVAWDEYLRRFVNFYFRCGAVEGVHIGKRGVAHQHWQVDLYTGNDEAFLQPLIPGLVATIRDARAKAGATSAPDFLEIAQQLGARRLHAPAARSTRSGYVCPTCQGTSELPYCWTCTKPI
jgi:ATP-dependent helicase IRC3